MSPPASTPLGLAAAPRTALVLAGGGSLGAVQVGMLRALVSQGFVPDLIVGASVGAINGAFFAGQPDAAGVQRLEAIWRRIRRRDVFPLAPLATIVGLFAHRDHLVTPHALRRLIVDHCPYDRLERASVPFHAVATDLLTGAEVRISSGPAIDALLASAAIPVVFPPIQMGDRYLVDGGVANHTPISVAVELGAARVVILPSGVPCAVDVPPRGLVAMALHALNLLTARQLLVDLQRFAGQATLVVVPPLCPLAVSAYDFSRTAELIERAAESTRAWLERGGLEAPTDPAPLEPHSHHV